MRTRLLAVTLFLLLSPFVLAQDLPDNAHDLPISHLLTLASTALSSGKSASALSIYDHILERDPTDFSTLYKRATIRLATGQLVKAKDGFRAVLAVRDFDQAHLELARIHAKLGEYAEALAEVDVFLKMHKPKEGGKDEPDAKALVRGIPYLSPFVLFQSFRSLWVGLGIPQLAPGRSELLHGTVGACVLGRFLTAAEGSTLWSAAGSSSTKFTAATAAANDEERNLGGARARRPTSGSGEEALESGSATKASARTLYHHFLSRQTLLHSHFPFEPRTPLPLLFPHRPLILSPHRTRLHRESAGSPPTPDVTVARWFSDGLGELVGGGGRRGRSGREPGRQREPRTTRTPFVSKLSHLLSQLLSHTNYTAFIRWNTGGAQAQTWLSRGSRCGGAGESAGRRA